jgi:hypothetical protein
MKKHIIGVIILSFIIMVSIIIGGIYYLKRMELPPIVPFIIFTIIIFSIILSINIAVIKKNRGKSNAKLKSKL